MKLFDEKRCTSRNFVIMCAVIFVWFIAAFTDVGNVILIRANQLVAFIFLCYVMMVALWLSFRDDIGKDIIVDAPEEEKKRGLFGYFVTPNEDVIEDDDMVDVDDVDDERKEPYFDVKETKIVTAEEEKQDEKLKKQDENPQKQDEELKKQNASSENSREMCRKRRSKKRNRVIQEESTKTGEAGNDAKVAEKEKSEEIQEETSHESLKQEEVDKEAATQPENNPEAMSKESEKTAEKFIEKSIGGETSARVTKTGTKADKVKKGDVYLFDAQTYTKLVECLSWCDSLIDLSSMSMTVRYNYKWVSCDSLIDLSSMSMTSKDIDFETKKISCVLQKIRDRKCFVTRKALRASMRFAETNEYLMVNEALSKWINVLPGKVRYDEIKVVRADVTALSNEGYAVIEKLMNLEPDYVEHIICASRLKEQAERVHVVTNSPMLGELAKKNGFYVEEFMPESGENALMNEIKYSGRVILFDKGTIEQMARYYEAKGIKHWEVTKKGTFNKLSPTMQVLYLAMKLKKICYVSEATVKMLMNGGPKLDKRYSFIFNRLRILTSDDLATMWTDGPNLAECIRYMRETTDSKVVLFTDFKELKRRYRKSRTVLVRLLEEEAK